MMRKILLPLLLLTSLAQAQEADLGPTLKRIAEAGTIQLGHREAAIPFSYVLADKATPAGFSWELCGRIVKAVEAKLGKEIRIVPVVATANARLMMVKVGMADIECGATTHTVGRESQVAFSNTFFVSEVKVMVRADSGIKSFTDLAGKRILTTSGSTADRLVKQAAMQRNQTVRQMMGRSHAESMAMLVRGDADAYVGDDAILVGERANSASPESYVLLPESLSVEPYGLALPKDDPAFKKLVDGVLVQLMQSGEFETLYNQWFMGAIAPTGANLNLPMSNLLKAVVANPNDRPVN
ncbi:MAG: amino acid ABC transporter substrate-binding protein [Azonexus sp.]|nr:amino acid ABC transporter substrate-binding protein [Azonexus sp.]